MTLSAFAWLLGPHRIAPPTTFFFILQLPTSTTVFFRTATNTYIHCTPLCAAINDVSKGKAGENNQTTNYIYFVPFYIYSHKYPLITVRMASSSPPPIPSPHSTRAHRKVKYDPGFRGCDRQAYWSNWQITANSPNEQGTTRSAASRWRDQTMRWGLSLGLTNCYKFPRLFCDLESAPWVYKHLWQLNQPYFTPPSRFQWGLSFEMKIWSVL